MDEVERPRRRDDRHDARAAQVEREVAEDELREIASEALDRILHVLRRESPGARELDEGALRLKREEDTREQLPSVQLPGDALPSRLAEKDAQVGRRVMNAERFRFSWSIDTVFMVK